MLDVGLYENPHVVIKNEYKKASHRRDTDIEEEALAVEKGSILWKLMSSARYCTALHSTELQPTLKNHSGLINNSNRETVKLLKFKQLLKEEKQKWIITKTESRKTFLMKRIMAFNDNSVSVFQNFGDQSGH